MASTPSATNITKPPRLVNGLPNSIFNSADFGTTDTDKYVKKSGDVLTGSLTCPTLVCNGGITLQSVYSSLPTQTQLGGVFKVTTSVALTNSTINTIQNFASLSLPAGCYIIFFNFQFVNNLNPPAATVTVSNIQGGYSLTNNNSVPFENRVIFMYGQLIGYSGGTTTLNGSSFFQHSNTTNQSLYLNCYVGVSEKLTVVSTFTAVRVG